jgi:hypothetical protein
MILVDDARRAPLGFTRADAKDTRFAQGRNSGLDRHVGLHPTSGEIQPRRRRVPTPPWSARFEFEARRAPKQTAGDDGAGFSLSEINGLEMQLQPVYKLEYIKHRQTNAFMLRDSLSFVSK